MGEILRQVEQSEALRTFLESRIPKGPDGTGCAPNCKWILEDLKLHGKLTGWPLDSFGKPEYPVDAKLRHIALEFGEPMDTDVDDVEVLAKLVLYLLTSDSLRN